MAADLEQTALHAYYERGEEADRLARSGAGRLEFERTQEIVLRHPPPSPTLAAGQGATPSGWPRWDTGSCTGTSCRCTSTRCGRLPRRTVSQWMLRSVTHAASTWMTRQPTPCWCLARST